MALSLVEVKEVPRPARSEWEAEYGPIVVQFSESTMQSAQLSGVPANKETALATAIKRYVEAKHIRNVHVCVRQKKVYLIKVNE